MSDEYAGGRRRAQVPRTRRVLQTFGYGFLTLTVALTLVFCYAFRTLSGNLNVVDWDDLGARPTKVDTGPQEPINVLVMGSDSRAGANAIDGASDGSQRSDTTILLHLSGNRQHAYGVSLPRDAMVQRPDCKNKQGEVVPGELAMFNDAFAIGGPLCTVKQVESLTDIRIDNFVVVDFNGFKGMVDAVGGVEICVPKEVNDTTGNIHLDAGRRVVKGQEALDYVRVRHGISANGDIGRMKRQQAFLASMAHKALSAGTLSNPVRLYNFLKAATKSLTVDSGLDDLKKIADLGMEFRGISLDDIRFITVPWEPWPEDPNRVVWTEDADLLWGRIRKDKLLTQRLSDEVISASGSGTTKKPKPTTSASPTKKATPTPKPSATPSKSAEQVAAENGLCS